MRKFTAIRRFTFAACAVATLSFFARGEASTFVSIRDLNRIRANPAQPVPPSPIKVAGRVVEVLENPPRVALSDGSGTITVLSADGNLGEFLVLEGDWDGSSLTPTKNEMVNEDVVFPPTLFMMGNSGKGKDADYGYQHELPQHPVSLASFRLSRTEVTRADYQRFIDAGGYDDFKSWSYEGWLWKTSHNITKPAYWDSVQIWGLFGDAFEQTDNFPVVGVSYWEADAYCRWAGGRLPTEAEWEMAARWSGQPRSYPWGDNWDYENCNNWCDTAAPGGGGPGAYQTARVGAYLLDKSYSGCMDMAGNVSEWVSDWYSATYYSMGPSGGAAWNNPLGPAGGTAKVVRGGNWSDNLCADTTRSAARKSLSPDSRAYNVGFRIAH
ncbi:MAG: SUMF1/EgtB/PvdO family nonheme iron enzyme [Armatimonadetes bacterium]|nr:SUMF1/EgtB/PvdO family nonheme iron enzyme [Armatimonadota bacterium]